jgi:hypothetical protein
MREEYRVACAGVTGEKPPEIGGLSPVRYYIPLRITCSAKSATSEPLAEGA